jgi:5-methylthioribose kinase
LSSVDIERPEQLLSYLRDCGHVERDESPQLERLQGGISNKTVLVTRENGEQWVLKQALEKLRVDVEWLSDQRRIHREASGMRVLVRLLPSGAVPRLLFEDFDNHLLAMTAVPEPHSNWKTLLLSGDVREQHVDEAARLLSLIHSRSSDELDGLEGDFGDQGYFQSLRLEPYYLYSGEQLPDVRDFLGELATETLERRDSLVHGDYSPKNLLVPNPSSTGAMGKDEARPCGRRERDAHLVPDDNPGLGAQLVLLDHEVVHLGDPAFDVGFFMTHLLSKAHHLASSRDRFCSAAGRFWERYREGIEDVRWLAGFEQRAVRHTVACLLARAVGRSRLEYLDEHARVRQAIVSSALVQRLPGSIPELIDDFSGGL